MKTTNLQVSDLIVSPTLSFWTILSLFGPAVQCTGAVLPNLGVRGRVGLTDTIVRKG